MHVWTQRQRALVRAAVEDMHTLNWVLVRPRSFCRPWTFADAYRMSGQYLTMPPITASKPPDTERTENLLR